MIRGKPTQAQLDALLERLSHDDAFREHVLGDPQAALKDYGLEVDPSVLHKARRLPSKEDLKASRDAVNEKVSGNLGLIILLA